jgi:hypothetical protein
VRLGLSGFTMLPMKAEATILAAIGTASATYHFADAGASESEFDRQITLELPVGDYAFELPLFVAIYLTAPSGREPSYLSIESLEVTLIPA